MQSVSYLRVSSKAQDIGMQRSAVERASAARGDVITNWYSEKRSAKTMARPELDRLRVDARAGLFQRLYVFRLDRLSRSGIRDTFELIEELRGHGVEVVSISDGFSLDGPAAEVILAVMAWAAKMERLAINERISAARERMKEEGKAWGRPRRLDNDTLQRIHHMRKAGKTIRAIAIALKVPRSTVADAVSENAGTKSAEAPPLAG